MQNPAIRGIRSFQKKGEYELTEPATYSGVVQKELLLLVTTFAFAFGCVHFGYTSPIAMLVTSIMALIVGISISFRPAWAPTLAPAYAILEGMMLGSFSLWFERDYPGIVAQAVFLTIIVAGVALAVFGKGLIKVDSNFMKITSTAILAVLVCGIIKLIAAICFGVAFPILEGGIIGITIDLVIVGIATMSLFTDYQMIRDAIEKGLPKEHEWVCAFALLVTLLWLYMRILELLRDIRR